MAEQSVSLAHTPDGWVRQATVGQSTLAVTHDPAATTFTFSEGDVPFLVLAATVDRAEDGTVTRAGLTADGDGLTHRITFDFSDEPGQAFTEDKLEAAVTVESDGAVHHGHFDGQAWQIAGLDDVPTLASLLAGSLKPRLAPLVPAFDNIIQTTQERTGITFNVGGAPTVPPSFETFSFRERFCKMACAVAHALALAGCCGASSAAASPWGCYVCTALAAASHESCTQNCED